MSRGCAVAVPQEIVVAGGEMNDISRAPAIGWPRGWRREEDEMERPPSGSGPEPGSEGPRPTGPWSQGQPGTPPPAGQPGWASAPPPHSGYPPPGGGYPPQAGGGYPPQPGGYPPPTGYSYGPQYPPYYGVPQGPSGLAITTLILGIVSLLGFTCLTGIPAWIMGSIELRNIREGTSPEGGRVMALIGMILGIITTVLTVLGVTAYILFIAFVVGAAATVSPGGPPPAPSPAF